MNSSGQNLRYPSALTPLHTARESMTDYYDPGVSIEAIAIVCGTEPARLRNANRRDLCAIYIIHLWGMRAAEYLGARAGDLLGNDFLLIHGAKGSSSYRILLPGLSAQFLEASIRCPGRLVSGTNYRRVYTACVRAQIALNIPGHKNLARTHLARYNLAKQTIILGGRTGSDLLHHRSDGSVKYYVGERR